VRLTTAAVDSGFSSRGVFVVRAKGWAGAAHGVLAEFAEGVVGVSILTLIPSLQPGTIDLLDNSLVIAATYQKASTICS
jgi:hypothetical protein